MGDGAGFVRRRVLAIAPQLNAPSENRERSPNFRKNVRTLTGH
ncbi:MAG TPA: hypothetical protein V6D12_03570 [Candidatus Obscuribacterales bacterium]